MYNNNDEMYEGHDIDYSIDKRKELISEAQKLASDLENIDYRVVSNLQKKWKRIQYWESVYEDQLEEEFEKSVNALYAVRNESFKRNAELKENLIKEAKSLLKKENNVNLTKEMNELMDSWKKVSSCGKDLDDKLWNEFNEVRKNFFDLKHEAWEKQKAKFEQAAKIKEELIEKALSLKDSDDWQKTSELYKDLMEEWKKAGSSGRELEDELWNRFQEARKSFFDRRNEFYKELHEVQNVNHDKKKALIEEAKAVLAEQDFKRENTEKMNQLNVRWKEIGNCGRLKENQVWQEFREVMDQYFAGLKKWNEEKHEAWRQRLLENRKRKVDLINNQQRQLEYMNQELSGILSEKAMEDMKDRIQQKQEFIEKLEKEVKDIDESLSK